MVISGDQVVVFLDQVSCTNFVIGAALLNPRTEPVMLVSTLGGQPHTHLGAVEGL
jgi:hypothetical protein